MWYKKVNSSECGRKCSMGSASGFQPARQLFVISWLHRDTRLPRVPAPSLMLPPATSLALSIPARCHAGMVVGPMGLATYLRPSCAPVPVGWYREGSPAALWGLLSLPLSSSFKDGWCSMKQDKWWIYRLRNPPYRSFLLERWSRVMIPSSVICVDWAPTDRLKPCICMTLLSFRSFLWLSLPSSLQSHPAITVPHAESKEIKQKHSALLAVNWLSTVIQLQLYRLKWVLSWQVQKLLCTFRALQLAVLTLFYICLHQEYTSCFQKWQMNR